MNSKHNDLLKINSIKKTILILIIKQNHLVSNCSHNQCKSLNQANMAYIYFEECKIL